MEPGDLGDVLEHKVVHGFRWYRVRVMSRPSTEQVGSGEAQEEIAYESALQHFCFCFRWKKALPVCRLKKQYLLLLPSACKAHGLSKAGVFLNADVRTVLQMLIIPESYADVAGVGLQYLPMDVIVYGRISHGYMRVAVAVPD